MNEQWIKQMQQKMADYKQPAPEVSWDAIDKAMAASGPHKMIPFRYWMRGIAAAVVLLLITGISIRIMNHQEETPVQQTAPVNNGQITTAGEEQLQPQLTDSPTEEPQPTYMAETTIYPSKKPKEKSTPAVSESEILADNTDTSAEFNNVANEIPVQEAKQEYTEPEEQTETFFDVPDVIIPRNKKHKTDRLMAQAYVSNAMSGSRQTESNRLTYLDGITLKPGGPISNSDMNNPVYYDTIITVNTVSINRNVRHHQPVKFGLSLRYQFDDRWSLESGLTYTLLVSDITTDVNGISSHSKQKLHYLGIPLNVGYQFWTDRKLGLYVSSGGTIDKLLNGSGWQFSVNGSAGAEYTLGNRFSLYAEPGLGYYFPNNSELYTIYQDHPWNFNLTFGLRFNLR